MQKEREMEMKKVNGGKDAVFSFLVGFFLFGLLIFLPRISLAGLMDDWYARNPLPQVPFTEITYGNKIFVAVGNDYNSTTILTSPDGICWVVRSLGASDSFEGVTYRNNTFVVVGYEGTILQSDPLPKVSSRNNLYSDTVRRPCHNGE